MDTIEPNEELKSKNQAKVNAEQTLALAKEMGRELTEEELDQVAGGAWLDQAYITCDACGRDTFCDDDARWVYCCHCGHKNGPFAPL